MNPTMYPRARPAIAHEFVPCGFPEDDRCRFLLVPPGIGPALYCDLPEDAQEHSAEDLLIEEVNDASNRLPALIEKAAYAVLVESGYIKAVAEGRSGEFPGTFSRLHILLVEAMRVEHP